MKKIDDPLQTHVVHGGTFSQKTGLKNIMPNVNQICSYKFYDNIQNIMKHNIDARTTSRRPRY